MRFFNLNIKYKNILKQQKESHSSIWLENLKEAPIFFGQSKIDEISSNIFNFKGRSLFEAKEFCTIGLNENLWEETTIITIDEGLIWIYKPSGKLHESTSWENYNDNVKSFPINMIKRISIREIPLILASMKSNQAFSRGTFSEIKPRKYVGNILAIESVLGVHKSTTQLPDNFSLLDCLSSIELETLIAKIFESRGCFVPAYKGGYMKDVDLLVKNNSENDILIDGLLIPFNSKRSIQVKLRFENNSRDIKQIADYNIGLDLITKGNNFGRDWVLRQTEIPQIKKWLNHSTEWVSTLIKIT